MAKKDVIKHTSAIHTSGTLSLLERKLSNVLLYNAYDDLLTKNRHTINISALCEVAGYNSRDRGQIKKALERLTSISITWDILNEDGTEQEWGVSSLLAHAVFKDGICTYEYSSALAEKLAEPEIYGRINLQVQKSFTSGYTLTIYEICSAYKGILNKRKYAYTKWMELEDFKKLVGVDESEYYNAFKELNRKIIKPSVAEINGTLKKYAGTDIFINPEYKRTNRKVSDIRFKIIHNPQMALPLDKDEHEEIRKTENYQRLIEYGFSDKGAIHAIEGETPEYIQEKLNLVDDLEKKGAIKSSASGYLKKAIDEDYKPAQKTNKARQEKERQKQEKEEQEQSQVESMERLKNRVSKEVRETYIKSLSKAKQTQLLEELKEGKSTIIKKTIKALSSPIIASELNQRIPDFDLLVTEKLEEEGAI